MSLKHVEYNYTRKQYLVKILMYSTFYILLCNGFIKGFKYGKPNLRRLSEKLSRTDIERGVKVVDTINLLNRYGVKNSFRTRWENTYIKRLDDCLRRPKQKAIEWVSISIFEKSGTNTYTYVSVSVMLTEGWSSQTVTIKSVLRHKLYPPYIRHCSYLTWWKSR